LTTGAKKTGKKIRDAQVKKIPYMIVIGDKEIETGVLPIRKYGSKDSVEMSVDNFISYVQGKISSRDIEY
jgi:threonyl-tRNA synthetase